MDKNESIEKEALPTQEVIEEVEQPENTSFSPDQQALMQKVLNARMKNKDDRISKLEAELQSMKSQSRPVTSSNENDNKISETPLTRSDLENILKENYNKQQQEEAQRQQEQYIGSAVDKANQYISGDDEFRKLVENPKFTSHPLASMHILNSFPEKTTKQMMSKIMTDELTNIRISNAANTDLNNSDPNLTALRSVLQSEFGSTKNDAENLDKNIPDLKNEGDYSDPSDNALKNYIKNKF